MSGGITYDLDDLHMAAIQRINRRFNRYSLAGRYHIYGLKMNNDPIRVETTGYAGGIASWALRNHLISVCSGRMQRSVPGFDHQLGIRLDLREHHHAAAGLVRFFVALFENRAQDIFTHRDLPAWFPAFKKAKFREDRTCVCGLCWRQREQREARRRQRERQRRARSCAG